MTEVPQSLDRFRIVRILGRGGMGTVYLARDERLNRQVALKVLNPEELERDDRHHRFLREARAAAAIRHPNVATIYEVEDTADKHYIVMEYCDGETLGQRIRRRPVDAGEFLNFARQITSGVAAAHDNGVVHRDIKAANVMIEPSGTVKILDFGLAKVSTADAQSVDSTSGHFFGTLHYLSPEQARGLQATERSDLFSIGILLYQMASGHLPFNADSPLLVLDKIRDSEPEPFVPLDPAFPQEATRIIAKLLQKNPADRYASAKELLGDLEAIEMPTVRGSTTSRSMLRRTRRRPVAVRAGVIATAIIAIAIAVYFGSRTAPPPAPPPVTASVGPIRSMAVLPLNNLAKSNQDDFLSVGLADALVTKLQQVPALQVRPTSSVLEFRDSKQQDVKTASQKLHVDGILDGHFLSAGDFVRVNLQLTDARTGYNIWADTIDGKRSDLLHLIDAVTSRTVNGLNQKLGLEQVQARASQPRSTNPKAFEEYLRARAVTGSLVLKDYESGIAALKRAIELDPNFAAAYADLAIALSIGQTRALTKDPNAIPKAEGYARQAVRLDPNLATAHLAMARVFVRYGDRFRESMRENLAALRLNPNDTQALWVLTTYFVSQGDRPKMQCVGDRLVALDPFSSEAKTRGYWYVNSVDGQGALDAAKYALQSHDTELAGHDIRANGFILLGNIADAEKEAAAASSVAPAHYLGKSLNAMIAATRGDRPAAERWLAEFQNDAARNHWASIRVALVRARLGDRDASVSALLRAAQLGHHSWYELIKHPWFANLQTDPAFTQIQTKIKADLDDVADDVAGVYQLMCH